MLSTPSSSHPLIAALLGFVCACGLLLAARAPLHAAVPAPDEQTPVLFPSATPTPTGTPRPTPLPAAASTTRPSAGPTATRRPLPQASVLVQRLRIRTGPGLDFPIVARAFAGDTLRVTGQVDDCTWLRVLTGGGVAGWVSGEDSFVTLNVECGAILRVTAMSTPTATPTATVSSTPTRTRTPTPSPTPSKSPVPPLALRPFVGPRTPTPVPTRPQARLSATPRAAAGMPTPTPDLLAALAAGGPTAVGAFFPEPGWEGRIRIDFTWEADAPLAPGQLFELAFWRPGQSPEDGIGWTEATTGTSLGVNLYDQLPGDYQWGIWLGGLVDGSYRRIRYLGGGNLLRIMPEGEPEPGSPPPNNCSPDAPCRP